MAWSSDQPYFHSYGSLLSGINLLGLSLIPRQREGQSCSFQVNSDPVDSSVQMGLRSIANFSSLSIATRGEVYEMTVDVYAELWEI